MSLGIVTAIIIKSYGDDDPMPCQASLTEKDQFAAKQLRNYRIFATTLLIVMFLLTIIGYLLPIWGVMGAPFWIELFRSGTKAGLIGGLADWFAITALFRRPLGLPIPHTAIISQQKDRLGKAFGYFIARHILTHEHMKKKLAEFDIPSFLARNLNNPIVIKIINEAIHHFILELLAKVKGEEIQSLIKKITPSLLKNYDPSQAVTQILRSFIEDDQHQKVLSFFLNQLRNSIHAHKDNLITLISQRVGEQGGKLVEWVIGGSIATRVLISVDKELNQMQQGDSQVRREFTMWANQELNHLEQDPLWRSRLSQFIISGMNYEPLRTLWPRMFSCIKQITIKDVVDQHGWFSRLLQQNLAAVVRQLQTDSYFRDKVKEWCVGVIYNLIPTFQGTVERLISSSIAKWDTDELIGKLELQIGKDLQYIRINGTVVGFLLGIIIYLLLQLVPV